MKRALLTALLLLATAPALAQRSLAPDDVTAIAKRVHDAERWNLGAASTRDQRIEFWVRVVGIVHHGHPNFNPAGGDPSWCIKDAGGGRPISDDVAVKCATREFWDFIGGAGADGYSFRANFDGLLPPEQNVYPPTCPSGTACLGGGTPTPTPIPTPAPADLTRVLDALAQIRAELAIVSTAVNAHAQRTEDAINRVDQMRERIEGLNATSLVVQEMLKNPPAYSGRFFGAGVTLRPQR